MAVNVSRFVQMAFIQEWSKRLSMNGSLNHWFTRIHSFIQKLNTAVLLGDSQQICCGFIGNIFIGKIEQKHTILCLKYNTILTSYLLNCCIKSHVHSWCSGQTALVSYCSRCSCDIAYHINVRQKDMRDMRHTGAFPPPNILNFRG